MKGELKMRSLPYSIQADIENYLVENAGATDIPDKMSVEQALKAYLEWNGLFGYLAPIISIIEAGQENAK